MTKIRATIQEDNNGAYYNVILNTVPREGEKISLFSHLDKSTGHNAAHEYKVVSVSHDIHDVAEEVASSINGHHEVTLLVKRC